jgi:hypothetical protein
MCDPVMAGLAVGAAAGGGSSLLAGLSGNKQLADMAESQLNSANEQYAQNLGRVTEESRQANQGIDVQKQEAERQGLLEQGTMLAALGDRGIVGTTPDKLTSNIIMSTALDKAGLEGTRDNQNLANVYAQTDIQRERASQINQTRAMVESNYVSPLEMGLNIIGGGMSGGAMGASMGSAFTTPA